VKSKEWKKLHALPDEVEDELTEEEEREVEAWFDEMAEERERNSLDSEGNPCKARLKQKHLNQNERSELIEMAFHCGSVQQTVERDPEDGKLFSRVAQARFTLRFYATLDKDEEVLAMFAKQEAEDDLARQIPGQRLHDDGFDWIQDPRAYCVEQYEIRILDRPAKHPRALRKRVDSPRCKQCQRRIFHCKCRSKAAEAQREKERDALDAIGLQEVVDWEAGGGGFRPLILAKRRNRRPYDPRFDADVPERGTREYKALLRGLFHGIRKDEWRADWQLSPEMWKQLEEDNADMPPPNRKVQWRE